MKGGRSAPPRRAPAVKFLSQSKKFSKWYSWKPPFLLLIFLSFWICDQQRNPCAKSISAETDKTIFCFYWVLKWFDTWVLKILCSPCHTVLVTKVFSHKFLKAYAIKGGVKKIYTKIWGKFPNGGLKKTHKNVQASMWECLKPRGVLIFLKMSEF